MNEKIKKLLEMTTKETGCYLLKNKNQNVIYIGKAKNIQKRLKQHFHNSSNNSKAATMIGEVVEWEIFITDNEKEALILEHNLIKKHFPKFNIVLADDQTYPYIFIPKQNPKYVLIWKKTHQPGFYFGPFPTKNNAKEIINLLQKLFPLQRCKNNKTKKPCFYYHLKQCSGACFQTVSKTYYNQEIKKIKCFYHGQVGIIKEEYQNKIKQAVKNLQFEQAEKYLHLLEKIDHFTKQQKVVFNDYKNYDFINFYAQNNEIIIVIFFYRQGKLQLKKEALFSLFNNSINETIENFLQEIYTYHPLPQELIIPQEIDLKTFAENYKVKVIKTQRGRKHKNLQLIQKNALVLWQNRAITAKQDNKRQVLSDLEQLTSSEKTISTIEFLDLSYLDSKFVIAGFTHYLNINPVWKKNKIYQLDNKIHNEKVYFQLAIVKHYQKNPLPDLLILDGAYTQLAGAKAGLRQLQQKTNLICLVKNEKHQSNYILTINSRKIKLPKTSSTWLALSKIQSLGHLYVIKNLRNLQKLKT